ncbi:MAG TPA: nucleoside hydrolase [Firmicutes bacterium]|nr:nucleoside hydrolase [Candidatus Fermentithermobacillaceae bacterium]
MNEVTDSKRIPVLIDCDPGHDDAVALILAFGSQRLDVLGVSTVAGNSTGPNTYRNARKILSFIGADVEVAKGAEKPILRPLVIAPNVHGESGLDGPMLPEPEPKGPPRAAIDLITDTLLTFPGKVTLVPTGPLTNIAIALLARPQIKDKIDRIVLMGGAALEGNWTPAAEFNIYVDPEAARIVFESGVPITMIGLDVTHKALIYPDEVEALRKSGRVGRVVAELMDFYSIFYRQQGFKGNPIHDAVAVAAVFEPDIVTTRYLHVDIETSGEFTVGRTVVDFSGVTGKSPNCHVALGLDRERFIKLIFDAVNTLEKKVADR